MTFVVSIVETAAGDAEPIAMVALIFVAVVALTALAVLWVPMRGAERISTLRARDPAAIVHGAQTDPHLDYRLSTDFALQGARPTLFGFSATVVADADGVSFWKGAGKSPDRRAFIAWEMIDQVTTGDIALARPLTSIRLEINGHPPVDFAIARAGVLGSFAVLNPATAALQAAAIEELRRKTPAHTDSSETQSIAYGPPMAALVADSAPGDRGSKSLHSPQFDRHCGAITRRRWRR